MSDEKVFEWHAEYTESKTVGTRFSMSSGSVIVYASNEDEAKQILAEEMPNAKFGAIKKGVET